VTVIHSIKAPDGNTYDISGPENATREQVIAQVLRQHPNAGIAAGAGRGLPTSKGAVTPGTGRTPGTTAPPRPRGDTGIGSATRPRTKGTGIGVVDAPTSLINELGIGGVEGAFHMIQPAASAIDDLQFRMQGMPPAQRKAAHEQVRRAYRQAFDNARAASVPTPLPVAMQTGRALGEGLIFDGAARGLSAAAKATPAIRNAVAAVDRVSPTLATRSATGATGRVPVTKALRTSLRSGGVDASRVTNIPASVAVRAAGGAGAGAAYTAAKGDDNIGEAALAGAITPALGVPLAKMLGGPALNLLSHVRGNSGRNQAAAELRAAVGQDNFDAAVAALGKAEGDETAVQALQRQNIPVDDAVFALYKMTSEGPQGQQLARRAEAQLRARQDVLDAAAGGAPGSPATAATDAYVASVRASTAAPREAAFGAANQTTGQYNALANELTAQTARADTAGQQFRNAMAGANTAQFGANMVDNGATEGATLSAERYRALQQLGDKAANRAAATSRDALARANAAKAGLDDMAAQGLEPLTFEPIRDALRDASLRPGTTPDTARLLSSVSNAMRDMIQARGGRVTSEDLDALRRHVVAEQVGKRYAGRSPTDRSKFEAQVLREIEPIIDDAITKAGGTGWGNYLSEFSSGMREKERRVLANKAAELHMTSPAEFAKLVRGRKEGFVAEAVPNQTDFGKVMGVDNGPSRMPAYKKVAAETEMDARIAERADLGYRAAVDVIKSERPLPMKAFMYAFGGRVGKVAGAVDFATALTNARISKETQRQLKDAFLNGATAAELMQSVPLYERARALKAMANPAFWQVGVGRAANAMSQPRNVSQ